MKLWRQRNRLWGKGKSRNNEKCLDHLPKGTGELLRFACRVSSADHVRCNFWFLLLECTWLFRDRRHGDADARAINPHERERTDHPPLAVERQRDRTVLYPDDHDASVRGREAYWDHRTAGNIADSRPRTDLRKVAGGRAAVFLHAALYRSELWLSFQIR